MIEESGKGLGLAADDSQRRRGARGERRPRPEVGAATEPRAELTEEGAGQAGMGTPGVDGRRESGGGGGNNGTKKGK